MILLLDNLLATIIGLAVGLVLLATQTNINEHGIERVRYYAARRAQATFLQTLERDLHNVHTLNSVSMHPTDSTFSFVAYLDSTNTSTGTIVYDYMRAGTVSGTPIYRVRRSVTVGGVTTQTGGSLDAITSWNIQAQTEAQGAVAAASDAKQIYVRFASVSPIQSGTGSQALKSVGTITWEARYRPPAFRASTDV